MKLLVVAVMIAACGGKSNQIKQATAAPRPDTVAERMLAMLPQGAQVVIEIDLARLRKNPVVGALVARTLDGGAQLPTDAPLATADHFVLAAYGVGTAQAATVTLLAAKGEIPGAVKISDGVWALGPEAWIGPIETRAALAGAGVQTAPVAPAELIALRDRAMPAGAPGASLRITAQLTFDARVALARQTGLESAPAQLSVWADVVDDFAIVIDADAADPGDKASKKATQRLVGTIRAALGSLAAEPMVRALGLPSSLAGARLQTKGTWVRVILAIGPAHLKRVVERAQMLLQPPGDKPS
ncbi:MAG TPA: hypothetical protein VIU61_18050 [Kofleriaceae bacterium]